MYKHTITSALAGLVLLLLHLYYRQRQRNVAARKNGYGPVVKHWTKEPFLAFDFQMAMHTEIPILYRNHRKRGHTFQPRALMGGSTILTIAPANLRAISTGKDWGIESMRLPGMDYFCGRGMLTTDGELWNHSRKLWKPTFAKDNLLDLAFLSQQVDNLLADLPADGTSTDLQPPLYTMFLNTSIVFLLGIDPTAGSDGAPHTPTEFITAFHDAMYYTMFRMLLGKAWCLVPQKKYLYACKVAHSYLDYYVDQVLDGGSRSTKTRSLLSTLAHQTNDRVYIRDQILQGMMASQETISTLIGNACFLLSRNPQYWQELRGAAQDPRNSELNFDTLLDFKITRNILFETLRLFPVFPIMQRIALQDVTLPEGGAANQDLPVFAPKGTVVTMSWYALHRDPSVFGDDVESFRPERWESINPSQWEFMGFGGGNRACMGQQKVLVEAAYVLMRFAQRYERLESRDSRAWEGELKLTCQSKHGCKVALYCE
ncbi:cytochrome P450 [Ophiobolus disseminans]|uniref:Cytochrome P450 n=1 Tax=Ophiobolus disseminans TaxID=1469910 RepID=A0A6A6ZC86_9PLEO|nr:cytochrome P450 [Ophiobolus disseminans]